MAKQKSTITEYRSYFLPAEFPVLLLSGEHWKISDIPSGRLHFHNCLEIGICHSYSGSMEIYDDKIPFKEGDITFIPKNIPHTTYSDKGTESRWSYLFIDPTELFKGFYPPSLKTLDITINPGDDFIPIFSKIEYPKISFLCLSILEELENKAPGYQHVTKGLLWALYMAVWRIQADARKENVSTETKSEKHMVLQPILDFIDKNYMEEFSIEYLADICKLSPTHFRRTFNSIMGTSPLEYLNSVRILKSCNLLRSTEDSILSISESVGFRSVSSFNRCFSQIMQVNPRTYRAQMHQAEKHNEKQIILEFTGWMSPE